MSSSRAVEEMPLKLVKIARKVRSASGVVYYGGILLCLVQLIMSAALIYNIISTPGNFSLFMLLPFLLIPAYFAILFFLLRLVKYGSELLVLISLKLAGDDACIEEMEEIPNATIEL